jgi:hypothetical protein
MDEHGLSQRAAHHHKTAVEIQSEVKVSGVQQPLIEMFAKGHYDHTTGQITIPADVVIDMLAKRAQKDVWREVRFILALLSCSVMTGFMIVKFA